ncbi:MAG: hypothetical protein KBT46_06090, partial [Ruminococcus sp.]|nr:hypothetical protein [Candidatus Copronaster equi]
MFQKSKNCPVGFFSVLQLFYGLPLTFTPAAIDTLYRYFEETGRAPASFDWIVTGDLGREG